VAIRGAGPAFCAGADLAELERTTRLSEAENLDDARRIGRMFTALRRHPRPVVALVTVRAVAREGGLATACDLVLAQEGAEIGYPECIWASSGSGHDHAAAEGSGGHRLRLVTRGGGSAPARPSGSGRARAPDPFGAAASAISRAAAKPPSAVALMRACSTSRRSTSTSEWIAPHVTWRHA
jgi:hypothetical protein